MFFRFRTFLKPTILIWFVILPGILSASPQKPGTFELLGGYQPNWNRFFTEFFSKRTAQTGSLPSSGVISREEEDLENPEETEEDKQEGYQDNRKTEVGVWVGASNPLPGTETQKYLDTTLGGGFFLEFLGLGFLSRNGSLLRKLSFGDRKGFDYNSGLSCIGL
ncbi:hypothetical protein LEP1GSC170_5679 [Leptospira interrogans serovar Bataviae str. HAI135]|nr:hypothetical protein LEP1GSC170_5679 [Leptospira interrogans serovar Bataviae str. HAI135]